MRPERPAGPLPTYGELVERYNRNIARLDRVWARTEVKLRWRNPDGKIERDQGDGVLLLERPDRVALTVGKLGNTVLWAGSDGTRFWVFDLQDDGTVYVGRHASVGLPCAEPLPLPVHPRALPRLLGLVPIDPNPQVGPAEVRWQNGCYRIYPPGEDVRLWLDPQTARPVRVELTTDRDVGVVRCELGDYKPVKLKGVVRDQWPTMATHADLGVEGEDAQMTLKLKSLSDGRHTEAKHRAFQIVFDYEKLRRKHKPAVEHVLDAECE